MNRMLSAFVSRIKNRKGWSARKTGIGSGRYTAVTLIPTPVAAAASVASSFDVHERLVNYGGDVERPRADGGSWRVLRVGGLDGRVMRPTSQGSSTTGLGAATLVFDAANICGDSKRHTETTE